MKATKKEFDEVIQQIKNELQWNANSNYDDARANRSSSESYGAARAYENAITEVVGILTASITIECSDPE